MTMNDTKTNFANGTQDINPPTMVLSDYLELTCNLISIFIGIPVNILAFKDVRRRMNEKYTRYTYLLLNLNISDLMVLTVYCVGKSVWMVTYEWLAGDLMCRLMRYFEAVSFSASSNIVICIACERLNSLRYPLSTFVTSWVRAATSVAWMWAAASMLPQLFFHQMFYPAEFQREWGQCVSTFMLEHNDSTLLWGKVYDVYHVCVLFYIPALILIVSYALLIRGLQSILSSKSAIPQKTERKFTVTTGTQNNQDINYSKATVLSPLILHRGCDMMLMKRKRLKALRKTLLLLTLYIVLWAPYNVLSLWRTVALESYQQYASEHLAFLVAIVPFNSVLNPLIYGRVIHTVGRWLGTKKSNRRLTKNGLSMRTDKGLSIRTDKGLSIRERSLKSPICLTQAHYDAHASLQYDAKNNALL